MSLIGNANTPASYVASYMQATVGFLGIPAGGFVADIEAFGADSEYSVESLYAAMLNSSIGRSIYAPGSSDTTFATKLVEKLGGSLLSDDLQTWAIDYAKTMLADGSSRAAVAKAFVEAVASVDTTDADFGALAQQFANRIEIANYYTFSSTNPSSTLSTLTAILDDVTNETDVSDPAAVLEENTDPGVSTGQTYTLTTSIDNITGTTGNDTIIGDFGVTGQVSAADQIRGGAGTDELQIYGTLGTLPTTITGVETLNLSGFGTNKSINVASLTDVTSVVLRNQADQSGDSTVTVAAGQSVTLNNIQDLGSGDAIVVSSASSVTSNTIVLDKAGDAATSGVALMLEVAGTGVTTLNLKTENNASRITMQDDGSDMVVATYNITGDKNLTATLVATTGSATKATVAAGSFTGNLDLTLSATENFEVTGGSGDDRFDFAGAFTTSDKVAGGTGTDTVAVNTLSGVSTWLNNKTNGVYDNSSIEVLEYTGTAGIALDASAITLSSLTSYLTSGAIVGTAGSGASASGVAAVAVTNQTNAQTFTIDGNVTGGAGGGTAGSGGSGTDGEDGLTFTPAVNNGSNVLNLTLKGTTITGGAAGADDTTALTGGDGANLANYETINIVSTGTASTQVNSFVGGASGGSGGTDGASIVVSANTTINISGANEINLGTISNSNQPVTINASSLTGKMTVGTGTAADVITGGSNVNTITLGGGADEVNLSASTAKADVINVVATNTTSSAYAAITGFTNAASTGDKLDVTGTAALAGDASGVSAGTSLTGSITSGVLVFAGANAATATLADKIAGAVKAGLADTANDIVAFEHDGSTYIVSNQATDNTFDAGTDILVKLVGVTGVTALSLTSSATNTIYLV